jgi:hypothetical protein
MKNILFPHLFQYIGWILFLPFLIVGTLLFFSVISFSGTTETIVNDATLLGIVIGAMFIVCSKERTEDEMTKSIRLASMLNSIYVYVILLVCSILIISGIDFLVFTVLNIVLLPIIFVINFRLEMYRYNKMCEDEEQD